MRDIIYLEMTQKTFVILRNMNELLLCTTDYIFSTLLVA